MINQEIAIKAVAVMNTMRPELMKNSPVELRVTAACRCWPDAHPRSVGPFHLHTRCTDQLNFTRLAATRCNNVEACVFASAAVAMLDSVDGLHYLAATIGIVLPATPAPPSSYKSFFA